MKNYSILFRIIKIVTRFLLKFQNLIGAKECRSRRSRKMLQNAPSLAIVAIDTEENERLRFGVNYSVKISQNIQMIYLQHLTSRTARAPPPKGARPRARFGARGSYCSGTAESLKEVRTKGGK